MFDLDTCVCFSTNKVAKKLADTFNERLLPFGVTRVQWTAMYFLLRDGRMSQKELSDKMNIKESTTVRLVDRMEKDGFIVRFKDSNDRRITYIELTEKGKKRIEELLPEGEKMSQLASRGISDEEIEIFKKVLDKFMENLENVWICNMFVKK